MTAAKRFGVINDEKGLDFFIPSIDEVDLKLLPDGFQNGYIGFVIGGKFNTKILPAEKVIDVIRNVRLPVILLGGSEDRERGELIKTAFSEKVFNACGLFTLMQSASLVKQAVAITANDTGLMHIAAAFNKKIISIWGNTVPEFGMYPYKPLSNPGESVISEVKGLRCRPCSRIGFAKCPKGHFRCMTEQDTEEISRQLNKLSSIN
jgi:ADP-heptose:LPS heptosyltransferase